MGNVGRLEVREAHDRRAPPVGERKREGEVEWAGWEAKQAGRAIWASGLLYFGLKEKRGGLGLGKGGKEMGRWKGIGPSWATGWRGKKLG
jgi:hypothetical protein